MELDKEVWGHFAVFCILEGAFTDLLNLAFDRADDVHLPIGRILLVLESLQALLGAYNPIIRIMPNTPVGVGEGMIVWCASANAIKADKELFLDVLAHAGTLDELPESLIDAATAVMGCGPAFVDLFIEALADGGVKCGLPRDKALTYATQMVLGSAKLVKESGKHPAELKDAVCSPGGSTIAGVAALEDGAFRASVIDAVESAFVRTKELSGK